MEISGTVMPCYPPLWILACASMTWEGAGMTVVGWEVQVRSFEHGQFEGA